ncbi:MAG: ABC transporter ATP-binding protein [Cyanobacteriota bacterium ELA615]|jgi:neutral amino acid transport system ATP-binding protein
MDNLLEIQDVYAGYIKDLNILQGVSLTIAPGELVVVIGPNGCGKSTLLKTIFGLLTPNQGTINFKGKTLVGLKSEKIVQQGLGYVPQIANVFPSLTIEENLEMGAFLTNGSITSEKEVIFNMFPRLAQRRRQKAGTLSGGERQMLAMGRALMLKPDLLLLDEPSAALSPILVGDVFAQIKAINQSGTSILLVEQNAKKALLMADRGYVLESGRDRYQGKGSELLNDPKVAALYLGGHHSS